MKNSYFDLLPRQRQLFFLRLVCIYVLVNIVMVGVLFWVDMPWLILLFFLASSTVITSFFDVPSGMKSGNLVYYSPMLIGEKIKNNQIVLHGGTLFDYYFTLNKELSVQERKKHVYAEYVEGMLALINKYECQKPTNIAVKATSYFLNSRTANKIGLQADKLDLIQVLILYFNFFSLASSMSFLNRKITWPKMGRIVTYSGDLDSLIKKKGQLEALRERLV